MLQRKSRVGAAGIGDRLFRMSPLSREPRHVISHPDDGDTTIASYNIHKGVGLDGRFDPSRTLAVIRELGADVVALQEANQRFGERICLVDMDRLAHECGLMPVRLDAPRKDHGWHGNIILFREGVVKDAHQLSLPGVEPRGAVIVDLNLAGGPLRIIAAHLGLLRHSRAKQVEALLKVAEAADGRPTLLMGDLNEWRLGKRSALHGLAPEFGPLHATVPSFPSRFPMLALDRVLGRPHDLITHVELHDTPLARMASDHLPVKAGLRLRALTQAPGEADGDPALDAA